jgi:hypothetical protein
LRELVTIEHRATMRQDIDAAAQAELMSALEGMLILERIFGQIV